MTNEEGKQIKRTKGKKQSSVPKKQNKGRKIIMQKQLPIPSFFNGANAASWAYSPNQSQLFKAAAEWRKEHGIKPVGVDKRTIHLLLIDVQKDFCFPQGSLYVAGRSGTGAIDDSRRTAEFIYRNLHLITDITTTLDTHFAHQIFYPSFWINEKGEPLSEHTMIQLDKTGRFLENIDPIGNVLNGNVRPNPAVTSWVCGGDYPWLQQYGVHYASSLKQAGKYVLYLWPPHCILGSDGHPLVGIIHEARMFHDFARSNQSWVEVKGGHTLFENYSVYRGEVLKAHDGRALGEKNTRFIKKTINADITIMGGQAASHCFKSSALDLKNEIADQDPKLADKVYIMTDCMSSVTVPDGKGGIAVDFTPQAEEAFHILEEAGMHLVKSTDPIESWPGINLN